MSLSAFEQLGGRGTARKWRRSVTTLDGSEAVSLGEWMERYQVMAGTEAKHASPHPSPKPHASTPPAGTLPPAAAAAGLPAAAWQADKRDQHGRHRQQAQTGTPRPSVPGQLPSAQQHEPLKRREAQQQRQHSSAQQRHLQQVSPQAAGPLPPMPAAAAILSPAAVVQGGSSPGSSPGGVAAAAAAADVRRSSVHTGGRPQLQTLGLQHSPLPDFTGTRAPAAAAQAGTPAGMGSAAAAGAPAGTPLNAELLLMLNEYASEYSHPELHLHPAQVEQDLEDLTAGTAGVLSPRLPSMDWQHQQQQRRQRQLPGPLFGRGLEAAAAVGAASYGAALLDAAAPAGLAAAVEEEDVELLAPASQDTSSLPTRE
ncbi:hypothetical protein COO60DRAFT_1163437 [Scenedesmus sp. NREL 46B-D3]|nr:hypothetical protein COO60DRAFT_1163437 [Scenedesmus sp. NREL 46B-D3]